ncbi:MAG TPA: LytTR family DNA-binding domain-containing protein [Burkholderiaceae bacterium]|jgi:two-component system LytT family response regulator|nr:LytTR family DNA-binding domain-containing protein [Burkholderiaceae bacterium]
MTTALIVDDEELARRLIREYLVPHADIEIIGECENGLQAVEEISRCNPDLIFLDIQMPKLNGLEVLAETGRRTGVIFTTAYDEYALKAFELHAVDYLQKPFSQHRFDDALEQARRQLGYASPALTQLVTTAHPERILIRDRGQTHIVNVAQIEYVEAQDDYIQIHAQGKTWMKTQSLSDLEAQLDPEKFVRVHRSFLVNIDCVTGIERISKDAQVAVLSGDRRIPISRAGHERLRIKI